MELDISNLGTVEVVAVALIGLVVMFFGYRIKKIAFFLIWFVLGYLLTSFLLPYLYGVLPEITQDQLFQRLIPLAGGLLLAMLGFSIEKLCVGGICFAVVMLITVQYFGSAPQTLVIGGILGILAAGIAVMCMKPAIIVATAVVGAYALTIAILRLIPGVDMQMMYFPSLIVLSVVGAVVQFLSTKRIA